MKNNFKKWHLFVAAAVLASSAFIVGCSSTTNLSHSGVKGLEYVKANPSEVKSVKRNNSATLAQLPANSFNMQAAQTSTPELVTASSNNEVVMNSIAQNKVKTDVKPSNLNTVPTHVVSNNQNTTVVKAANVSKPKSNKGKMILLGILSYLGLLTGVGAVAQYKTIKAQKANKKNGDCKSWIVALLLCTLLGDLGIHRFYLGYIWQGVVQLLTLGGCGIWTLIDWIRIIMKTLPPKDGDYC